MIVEKEMGLTHADFFRLLPAAMGNNPYEVQGQKIFCKLATGTLKITLGEEGERKLALVRIPCTTVIFEYRNVADADRKAFTKYFDLRFMRGLG